MIQMMTIILKIIYVMVNVCDFNVQFFEVVGDFIRIVIFVRIITRINNISSTIVPWKYSWNIFCVLCEIKKKKMEKEF